MVVLQSRIYFHAPRGKQYSLITIKILFMENQEPKKKWFYKSPWFWVLSVLFFIWIVNATSNNSGSSSSAQAIPTVSTPVVTTSTPTSPAPENTAPAKQVKAVAAPVQPSTPTPAPVAIAPTPAPALVTPTAPTASWHTAFTYSNNVDSKSPPFSMQGSQWRITYTCSLTDSSTDTNIFGGFIWPINSNTYAESWDYMNCPTTNTSYGYTETPGQYYLDVRDTNATYTITVEDYY
jgi:hypothetical protein